jgi:hypothetical protein
MEAETSTPHYLDAIMEEIAADPVAAANTARCADEDRAGGRNTLTRFADADLCTPGRIGDLIAAALASHDTRATA